MVCPSFVPILAKVSQFAVSLCLKAPLIAICVRSTNAKAYW